MYSLYLVYDCSKKKNISVTEQHNGMCHLKIFSYDTLQQ